MQAASNFLQDKVLGGPLPIDQNAAPEWNERKGESQKALTWQAVNKVELKDMPVPDITEDKDVILRVTGALPRLFPHISPSSIVSFALLDLATLSAVHVTDVETEGR